MKKGVLKSNLKERGYAKEIYMNGRKKECSKKQKQDIDIGCLY